MKILLITAEKALDAMLTAKGFRVESLSDRETAAEHIQLGVYDLLILDEAIQALDLIQIRSASSSLPVILLSDNADTPTRAEALNAGADYCLAKPVDSRELIACINALLRRQGNLTDALSFGDTELNPSNCTLSCRGRGVRLSAKEFDVMRALLRSGDRITPKETLLARVWGYSSNAVDNHVEVYIAFLRRKLESIDADITITTQRRMGYYLSKK